MKTFLTLTTLLLMVPMAHCTEPIRQRHAVSGIERVVIETPGSLQIRPGPEAQLTIEAEPEVLRQLDNVSEKGVLYLRSKGSFSTQRGLRYELVIPRLRALSVQGSGDVTVGDFRGEALDVDLGGSGEVALEGVKIERLGLQLSGSGNIEASGRGNALQVEIAGSGGIGAEGYAVARAVAKITGSGNISVHADKQLTAIIDGSGNIQYKGHPVVTQSVSGSGSVDPL
jgi:hypothetical protein